jgi:hypothetical protein
MALRYHGTLSSIPLAGSVITHGITNPQGTAAAPTAWSFNHASGGSCAGGAQIYRFAAPTTTAFSLAASTTAAVVDIFCELPHSIISGL